MAGKHVGGIINRAFQPPGSVLQLATHRPAFPGSRADCAYAEGRRKGKTGGVVGDNPYPSTANGAEIDLYWAWNNGFLNQAANNVQHFVQTQDGMLPGALP